MPHTVDIKILRFSMHISKKLSTYLLHYIENRSKHIYSKKGLSQVDFFAHPFVTNAKMIFATSPSVVEEEWTVYKRYNKMIEEYNDAAVSIVKSHGGDINDLYKITRDIPKEYRSDITHFYMPKGTQLISEQVKQCIEDALNIKGHTLDYEELFLDFYKFTKLLTGFKENIQQLFLTVSCAFCNFFYIAQ